MDRSVDAGNAAMLHIVCFLVDLSAEIIHSRLDLSFTIGTAVVNNMQVLCFAHEDGSLIKLS